VKIQAKGNHWATRELESLPSTSTEVTLAALHDFADQILAILSADPNPSVIGSCTRMWVRLSDTVARLESSLELLKVKSAACRSRLGL